MNSDQASKLTASLAAVIRERRISSGLSKNRLAQDAGLAYQTVAFIEDCERRPTVETVARLADAMDTTASELIKKAEKRVK